MKRLLLSGLLALTVILACITKENPASGAITPEMLQTFERSASPDAFLKSAQNAVSANDIKNLVYNRDLVGTIDHHFAHRIKTPSITDQKSSGRCWLFTALNVLRPQVVSKYNLKDFEFSQNYLFFYDQLEKANLFLETVLRSRAKTMYDREMEWLFQNPIADGGVWSMMPGLIEKYRCVPKEIMPDTYNSANTAMMTRLLKRKLREQGLELFEAKSKERNPAVLQRRKTEMLAEIYRMLVIFLGTPPREFSWRYLNREDSLIVAPAYTPQRFYSEVVNAPLGDYVMLMDDPTRDYYKLYEIEYYRNRFDSPNWTYINLPVDKIKQYARASILADQPLYFSCDVGKDLDRQQGFLINGLYDFGTLLGVTFKMDKRARILTFDSGSSHGMALIGVDTAATGQPTKWLLENSWGTDDGYKGFLTMTDEWFGEYMFRLVILRRFLPPDVLQILTQKPIKLDPWDRMN